jgi:hypothetical protein
LPQNQLEVEVIPDSTETREFDRVNSGFDRNTRRVIPIYSSDGQKKAPEQETEAEGNQILLEKYLGVHYNTE